MCDNHFSVLDIAISMVQQHFIKLTLNVRIVYNVLVAHICTMIRFLKYFILTFLLNKRSKHKLWTLISRSQEARLVSQVLCGAFYLIVDTCLYTLSYDLKSIWDKLCVGLTLIA